MGITDRFGKRRRPTPEQAERLSHITNPHQRSALLKAIAEGEAIPDYAWNPLSIEFDPVDLVRRIREAVANAGLSDAQSAEEKTGGQAPTDDVDGEIVRCAEMLRRTATTESGYLSPPIDCPALASARLFTPLLAWAFFNPLGPTLCTLLLLQVPGTGEQLIFFRSLNPFATSAIAYGLVPHAAAQDVPRIVAILDRLFSGDDTPMANLPTHVQVPPGSPLEPAHAREIVLTSVKRIRSNELAVSIQRLKAYKGDPSAAYRCRERRSVRTPAQGRCASAAISHKRNSFDNSPTRRVVDVGN